MSDISDIFTNLTYEEQTLLLNKAGAGGTGAIARKRKPKKKCVCLPNHFFIAAVVCVFADGVYILCMIVTAVEGIFVFDNISVVAKFFLIAAPIVVALLAVCMMTAGRRKRRKMAEELELLLMEKGRNSVDVTNQISHILRNADVFESQRMRTLNRTLTSRFEIELEDSMTPPGSRPVSSAFVWKDGQILRTSRPQSLRLSGDFLKDTFYNSGNGSSPRNGGHSGDNNSNPSPN